MECNRQSVATWWNQTLQMRAAVNVQTCRRSYRETEGQRAGERCRKGKRTRMSHGVEQVKEIKQEEEKKVIKIKVWN